MDCREVEKIIPLYLDGEFSGKDTEELEAHIKTCSRCKRLLEEEEAFKTAISSIKLKRAPASLRAKIERQLGVADKKSTAFSMFKAAFVAGTTALAVVSTVMLFNISKIQTNKFSGQKTALNLKKTNKNEIKLHTSKVDFDDFDYNNEIIPATYTEPVTVYTKPAIHNDLHDNFARLGTKYRIPPITMENLLVKHYTGVGTLNLRHKQKINEVRKWMHQRIRKIRNLPSFKNLNAKFGGAALTEFNNRKAVQIKYHIHGKPVTLLMFSPERNSGFKTLKNSSSMQNPEEYISKTPGGRIVAVFIHKNVGFSIVSELSRTEIIKMIEDIVNL